MSIAVAVDIGLLIVAFASMAVGWYAYVHIKSSANAANRSADAADKSAFEAERSSIAAEASLELAKKSYDRAGPQVDLIVDSVVAREASEPGAPIVSEPALMIKATNRGLARVQVELLKIRYKGTTGVYAPTHIGGETDGEDSRWLWVSQDDLIEGDLDVWIEGHGTEFWVVNRMGLFYDDTFTPEDDYWSTAYEGDMELRAEIQLAGVGTVVSEWITTKVQPWWPGR